MNAHQVEAEAVQMIFVEPVENGFFHVFPHHGAVACRLVTAGGAVGKAAIGHLAVEISGYCTLKVAFGGIERVVVDYIKHYTDASLVQGLHHLFELPDTDSRVVWVGGIGTVGDVVVLRVIAPIVSVFIQLGFVHGGIVVGGQNVYVRHSQFFQMVNACRQLFGT